MPSTSSTLCRIPEKLDTTFYDDYVVHERGRARWWGTIKEKWIWKRDIGAGGFGVVWVEEEAANRQLRAVKRLTKLEMTAQNVDFRRELQTLVTLTNHQELFVQFLGWYEDKNFIYLAMEYLEYGDLEQYLERSAAEAKTHAVEITRQLLNGLMVLEERQICHRDLKPQNVLIASISPIKVKLADFGASKSTMSTRLKTQCGTPGYQAPELLGLLPKKGRNLYTIAVDMWALGCLVHKILTLETPFLEKLDTEYLDLGIDCTGVDITAQRLQTDMNLFHAFCSGKIDLPTEVLRSQVDERGVDFVKSLLVADPRSRISPRDALNHRWMFDFPRIFNQENALEVFRNQFMSLDIEISPEASKGLFLACRKRLNVDIGRFLSPSMLQHVAHCIGYLQHQAASKGYTLILELLLLRTDNEDIDFEIGGCTMLQAAAEEGHLDVVRLLLANGAKMNTRSGSWNGRTALTAATEHGHYELVKFLLERGAEVNGGPGQWNCRTALQGAAESGNLGVVELLVSAGADVNARPAEIRGRTALQAAAQYGHLEVIKFLLKRNADVNAEPCEYGGLTALQAAAKGGHVEAARLLVEWGADINAEPCSELGVTVFQAATEAGNLDLVQLLLERNVKPNAEITPAHEQTRRTPALQAAAGGGHVEVVRLLLEKGAEVNTQLSAGVLYTAAKFGHLEVVRLLLERGADVNAEYEGRTALQAAARGGHLNTVRLLLENKAVMGIKLCWELGPTTLKSTEHLELVKLLLWHSGTSTVVGTKFDAASSVYNPPERYLNAKRQAGHSDHRRGPRRAATN